MNALVVLAIVVVVSSLVGYAAACATRRLVVDRAANTISLVHNGGSIGLVTGFTLGWIFGSFFTGIGAGIAAFVLARLLFRLKPAHFPRKRS